jgi:hypothetical protein
MSLKLDESGASCTERSKPHGHVLHRKPATAITPWSIAAGESADGIPEGWVTHTAKGTYLHSTCQLTFFQYLKDLRMKSKCGFGM